MLSIAICDPNLKEAKQTQKLIQKSGVIHGRCTIHRYTAMSKLQSAIGHGRQYGLLVLEVNFPDKGGIDGAKELRAHGYQGCIAFCTHSDRPEDAIAAFGVDAIHYLVKPVELEDIQEALHRLKGKQIFQIY